MWYSIKDFLPGRNVGKILLYFSSSQNVVLVDLNDESSDTSCVTRGYVFKKKNPHDKPENFVDYPTHWMKVKFPQV